MKLDGGLLQPYSAAYPNLFADAPSELSQDAFLCWLFRWLNVAGHPMQDVSRGLVDRLAAKWTLSVDWQAFREAHIARQLGYIDIVLILEFSGRPSLAFVVEDKIDAAFTNDIEAYCSKLLSKAEWKPAAQLEASSLHPILFQTGFDYDMPETALWRRFGWMDIANWLDSLTESGMQDSDILSDWTAFQRLRMERYQAMPRLLAEQMTELLSKVKPDYDNRKFESIWADPVLQFLFMKRIFGIHPGDVHSFEYEGAYSCTYLHTPGGVSQGLLQMGVSYGRRWIQYWPDIHRFRQILYRLDWLSGMWSLSLRSVVSEKENEPPREVQVDLVQRASQKFLELSQEHGLAMISYSPRANARETARVVLDPCQGSGFLAVSEVHRQFVRWLETEPANVTVQRSL